MIEPQAWLPQMALVDGALTEVVRDSLVQWKRKWISRPGQLSVSLQANPQRQREPAEGWRTPCGSLALCADRERILRLGATILGFRRPPRRLNGADASLLQALVADASDNLITLLATRFPATSGVERMSAAMLPRSSLRYSVAGSYGRLFDLSVSASAATAARKSLVSPQRVPAPLTSRRKLEDALTVNVSARIGTSQITPQDLRSLTVNDVLILDAKLSEPPRLAINSRVVDDRRLKVARKGASLVICNMENETA